MNNLVGAPKKSHGIQRVTEITLPPIGDKYDLNSLIGNTSGFSKATQKESMDGPSLVEFINSINGPVFICHLSSKDDLGYYAFINEHREVRKQLTDQRSNGRFFLKQFFKHAVQKSNQGTGIFEVYPLPRTNDLENGQITHYFSRGNDIFRSLSGMSLQSIGLLNKLRRDSYEDENGSSLPVYRYDLTCSLLLIQSEKKSSLASSSSPVSAR